MKGKALTSKTSAAQFGHLSTKPIQRLGASRNTNLTVTALDGKKARTSRTQRFDSMNLPTGSSMSLLGASGVGVSTQSVNKIAYDPTPYYEHKRVQTTSTQNSLSGRKRMSIALSKKLDSKADMVEPAPLIANRGKTKESTFDSAMSLLEDSKRPSLQMRDAQAKSPVTQTTKYEPMLHKVKQNALQLHPLEGGVGLPGKQPSFRSTQPMYMSATKGVKRDPQPTSKLQKQKCMIKKLVLGEANAPRGKSYLGNQQLALTSSQRRLQSLQNKTSAYQNDSNLENNALSSISNSSARGGGNLSSKVGNDKLSSQQNLIKHKEGLNMRSQFVLSTSQSAPKHQQPQGQWQGMPNQATLHTVAYLDMEPLSCEFAPLRPTVASIGSPPRNPLFERVGSGGLYTQQHQETLMSGNGRPFFDEQLGMIDEEEAVPLRPLTVNNQARQGNTGVTIFGSQGDNHSEVREHISQRDDNIIDDTGIIELVYGIKGAGPGGLGSNFASNRVSPLTHKVLNPPQSFNGGQSPKIVGQKTKPQGIQQASLSAPRNRNYTKRVKVSPQPKRKSPLIASKGQSHAQTLEVLEARHREEREQDRAQIANLEQYIEQIHAEFAKNKELMQILIDKVEADQNLIAQANDLRLSLQQTLTKQTEDRAAQTNPIIQQQQPLLVGPIHDDMGLTIGGQTAFSTHEYHRNNQSSSCEMHKAVFFKNENMSLESASNEEADDEDKE